MHTQLGLAAGAIDCLRCPCWSLALVYLSQALLLHDAKQQDAITVALQGMPGYEQQDEQLLRSIGLPPGRLLTTEQVRLACLFGGVCMVRLACLGWHAYVVGV